VKPPASETELLRRAEALGGMSLRALAGRLNATVPGDPKRAKGWVGELLERELGATAGNRPEPDFAAIGIELKTIPVSESGRPRESTFVCVAPMKNTIGLRWDASTVKLKLERVLWVPVLTPNRAALDERMIGRPFLWSPSAEQSAVLRADWEEHMELLALGHIDEINARVGVYLQIRPKALSGSQLTDTYDEGGAPLRSLPRGFYLRPSFTYQLLSHR
jgi:DNA mismatch repair protein MutH